MSFTSTGIRVWDSTEGASIHGASAAMATTLNTKVTSAFADETARNAAFTAYTSAQKAGVRAWVSSRGGFSYWDDILAAWVWEPQDRTVVDVGPFAAFSAASSPSSNIGPATITVVHPGGLRKIRVVLNCRLKDSDGNPITTFCAARLFLLRNGGEVLRAASGILPNQTSGVGSNQICVDRTFKWSGTSVLDMQLLREGGSGGSIQADSVYLTVTDLGPTD